MGMAGTGQALGVAHQVRPPLRAALPASGCGLEAVAFGASFGCGFVGGGLTFFTKIFCCPVRKRRG